LTQKLAAAYGLSGPWGAIITAVEEDSPAAQAKLREGDIITRLDDENIDDNRALLREVLEAGADATATLRVWRERRFETVAVKLASLPADQNLPEFLPGVAIAKPDIPPEASIDFGLQLSAVTAELRAQYKLDEKQEGVVITAVALGSEAADLDVDAGLVIMRVRDVAVRSPEEFRKAVEAERAQQHSIVPTLISGSEGPRWVPFTLY